MGCIIDKGISTRCEQYIVALPLEHISCALKTIKASGLAQPALKNTHPVFTLITHLQKLKQEYEKFLEEDCSADFLLAVRSQLVSRKVLSIDRGFVNEVMLRQAPEKQPKRQDYVLTLFDSKIQNNEAWNKLRDHIAENRPLRYFLQDPDQRAAQYDNFMQQLWCIFKEFLKEPSNIELFFDVLSELPHVCPIGWSERIHQLQCYLHINDSQNHFLFIGHRIGRDIRRVTVEREVGRQLDQVHLGHFTANVHVQLAIKQVFNYSFNLGYSNLGEVEAAATQLLGRLPSYQITVITLEALQELKVYYNSLEPTQQEELLAPLLDLYAKEALAHEELRIASAQSIDKLYSRLEVLYRQGNCGDYWAQVKALQGDFLDQELIANFGITELDHAIKLLKDSCLGGRREANRLLMTTPYTMEEYKKLKLFWNQIKADYPEESDHVELLLQQLMTACSLSEEQRLSNQQKRFEQALLGKNDVISRYYRRQLEHLMGVSKGELSLFGAALWAVSIRLYLAPRETGSCPEEVILSWMQKVGAELLINDAIFPRLRDHPELYHLLSPAGRQDERIVRYLKGNPGLIYGVSKERYETMFHAKWFPIAAWKPREYQQSIQLILDLAKKLELGQRHWFDQRHFMSIFYPYYNNSRELFVELIKINPMQLIYASDRLKNDRELVSLALNSITLCHFTSSAKHINHPSQGGLDFLGSELIKDRDLVLAICRQLPTPKLPPYWGADAEIVYLAAREGNLRSIEGISPELLKRKDLILMMLKNNRDCLEDHWVWDESFSEDRDFLYQLLELTGGRIIKKFPNDLLQEKDELIRVLAYVERLEELNTIIVGLRKDSPLREDADFWRLFSIKYEKLRHSEEFAKFRLLDQVSKCLLVDDTFVREILKKDPESLQCVSLRLRSNEVLVRELIELNPRVIACAAPSLQKNVEIAKLALRKDSRIWNALHKDVKSNRAFLLEALEFAPFAPFAANAALPSHFWDDVEVVIKLAKHRCGTFYLSDRISGDRQIMKKICRERADLFLRASTALRRDEAYIIELEREGINVLSRADNSILKNKAAIIRLVTQIPSLYRDLSREMREDRDLALVAVRADGLLLERVLLQTEEIVQAAVKQNPLAITFARATIKRKLDKECSGKRVHI